MIKLCAYFIVAICVYFAAGFEKALSKNFGCKSIYVYQKLSIIRSTGNNNDFQDKPGKTIRAGECFVWENDTKLTNVDSSDGLSCVSLNGSGRTCYWSGKD